MKYSSFVHTMYKLYTVGWRVFSTEEAYHQYDGGYSVWMVHTISAEEAHHQYGGRCAVRWRSCSTDLSHNQYGCGTFSVWWRVCGTDLSHHQYSRGCAIRIFINWSSSVAMEITLKSVHTTLY